MVSVKYYPTKGENVDLKAVDDKLKRAINLIQTKSGLGNDYIGWLDYASRISESEISKIEQTAARLINNFDILVVCGIGGSYLGARAAIDAINGLYCKNKLQIIYMGNTLSSEQTAQILDYLKDKKFAVNVISKSGTTTETAVAFRLLKQLLLKQGGKDYLSKAIVATTDKAKGALRTEADANGYETFIIPDDIGGRFSVITPVGLLPMAAAQINIREFLKGVIDGQNQYSISDVNKNPAYYYGGLRYALHTQLLKSVEMFVTYQQHHNMISEWLKQLFDESEGKQEKALLCTSACFTTDLHSMGQFIQQGSHILYETIIKCENSRWDCSIPKDNDNLDNLNYLADKKLSYINDKAFQATLNAHNSEKTPVIVLSIDKMDAYNFGNLVYFFFRACACSAYMLDVNPFNQPGVEIYKKNMFQLLGKPGYTK